METVVIIGGGFAGLTLAKRLDPRKFDIKVVDRNNFHSFPPLFYQIASSGLSSPDILFPFRDEFRKRRNISYHMGHIKMIDIESRTVETSYETLSYDRLVIAAGSANNYFGNDNLRKESFGIKTANEAMHTRDEIIDRLERASICHDRSRRHELLSFLVVGGGPAGVEIAGAIGEMKRYVIPKEYPELSPDEMSVTLVEDSDTLLGPMGRKCGNIATKYLSELMVDVRLNTRVEEYSGKYVTYADGRKEYAETVIWTAGVCGENMPGIPDRCLGHGGRIKVDGTNLVEGMESVYAIGDICIMECDEKYPHGHPQVAPVAIQQARNLAHNLNGNKPVSKFHYRDKGSMATIGKNKAVVKIGNKVLGGFPAWIIWLGVHLISITGMRNRIFVFCNWIWNYFCNSSALRLLLRPAKYPLRKHWGD